MTNEEIEKEIEIYKNELLGGKFKMGSLKNNEEDYSEAKQNRDLEAFKSFLKTKTFKEFMERTETL